MTTREQYDQASTIFLKPGETPPPIMITLPNGQTIDYATIQAMSPEDREAWFASMEASNPEDIE